MHTDEAVHGVKFGQLLEEGNYRYDKFDYHGPTLNYFTLIPALIRAQSSLSGLDEFTLRSVTAFFGSVIILLLLFLRSSLRWKEILQLAILLAIAPMLVYYSRYYIQEVLLVFFNIGFIISAYQYILSKRTGWIVLAGLFAGLMMATKETWIIFFGIQGITLLLVLLKKENPSWISRQLFSFVRSFHFLLFLLLVATVYILFYSSFFDYPQGIIESVKAFGGYFTRAGSQESHGHPWWYYLKVITNSSGTDFLIRADAWFLIGGIAGFVLLLISKKKDPRYLLYLFLGYITIISGILLSILSYKTPWNFLMTYTGLIFLTSYIFTWLVRQKKIFLILFIFVFIHLGYQTYNDNFIDHSIPQNTLAYAHPSGDVLEISRKVHDIYRSIPEDKSFYINVIYPDHEYWPFPWYFRDLPNVGWQEKVDLEAPAAPLIVTNLPNPELSRKLYELPPPGQRFLYIPIFEEDKRLRPGAPVNVLLRKDYLDVYKKFSSN